MKVTFKKQSKTHNNLRNSYPKKTVGNEAFSAVLC
jgi:hypothetical protein